MREGEMTDESIREQMPEILPWVRLIGSCGATELEIGYLHDDVPVEEAGWFARVRWGGRIAIEENAPGPLAAVVRLANQITAEGQCNHCLKKVHPVFEPAQDANDWPERCAIRWNPDAERWIPSCLVEGAETATRIKLAAALNKAGCPPEMCVDASGGEWDDFVSRLPFPKFDLLERLRSLGKTDLIERVEAGEFDSSPKEAEAWLKSPEGTAAAQMAVDEGESAVEQLRELFDAERLRETFDFEQLREMFDSGAPPPEGMVEIVAKAALSMRAFRAVALISQGVSDGD